MSVPRNKLLLTGLKKDPVLKEFKIKANELKKAVEKDKKEYGKRNLNEDVTVSHAWKAVRNLLGSNKNLSPSIIISGGTITSNPSKIASTVNNFFCEKVRILRIQTLLQSPTL